MVSTDDVASAIKIFTVSDVLPQQPVMVHSKILSPGDKPLTSEFGSLGLSTTPLPKEVQRPSPSVGVLPSKKALLLSHKI